MVIFAGLRHVLVVCAEVSDIRWLFMRGSQRSGGYLCRSQTCAGCLCGGLRHLVVIYEGVSEIWWLSLQVSDMCWLSVRRFQTSGGYL